MQFKKALMTFTLATSASMLWAVEVGTGSGLFLRGPELSGTDGWDSSAAELLWANEDGSAVYYNFNTEKNGEYAVSDRAFAIGPRAGWDGKVIVAGDAEGNAVVGEPFAIYYGGNRNGHTPATGTYRSIYMTLPTNTEDATDEFLPDTGAGYLTFLADEYYPEGFGPIVDTNEYADFWLRGGVFGDTDWSNQSNDAYRFRLDAETGYYYVNFPGGFTIPAEDTEFAISGSPTGWPRNTVIVPGANVNLVLDQELPIFYGGSHNGVLPAGAVIERIEIRLLPSNDEADYNFAGDATPAQPAEGAGVLFIKGYYPLAGLPVVDSEGKGNILFGAWDLSDARVSWNTSGGLNDVLRDTTSPFFSKYVKLHGERNMIAGRLADEALIVDVPRDGEGNPLAVEGYDGTQIIRYHENASTYVIDFTEYDPQGVLLTVPLSSEMANNGADDVYADVPMILRSGVRFDLINANYGEGVENDPDAKYRFIKYGRVLRLNGQPVNMLDFGRWNDIDLTENPNPTIEETTEVKNKIGDNRLLAEYDVRVKRIIIEVENEGMRQSEKVWLRFEGEYVLDAVTAIDYSYSFDRDADLDANHRSDSPNIFNAAIYRWYDRGFNRFYANTDVTEHGYESAEDFEADRVRYALPDFSGIYSANVEYDLTLNADTEESFIYFDNVDGTPELTNAKFNRNYAFNPENGRFYNTETGELMSRYSFSERTGNDEQEKSATRLTILGQTLTLIYNPEHPETLPRNLISKVTYHFCDEEPSNYHTYTATTPEIGIPGVFYMSPDLKANPLEWHSTEDGATYTADLNINDTEFLKVTEYVTNDEGVAEKVVTPAPVLRWEFTNEGAYINDDEDTVYDAADSSVSNDAGDELGQSEDNTFGDISFSATTPEINAVPDENTSVTVNFNATAIIRQGKVTSSILISEAALHGLEDNFIDENGEPSNLFATNAANVATKDGNVTIEFANVPVEAKAPATFTVYTSIDAIDSAAATVTIDGRTISCEGSEVSVYSVDGALQGSGSAVTVPAAGLYIVKTIKDTVKTIVK